MAQEKFKRKLTTIFSGDVAGYSRLMQVIIPDHSKDDDDLKRAFQWVSDELKYNPKQNADELIEEAIYRFDLTLMEAESISIMFADISKRPKPTYPWTNFGL